jgi:hypothetical protein
MKFEDIKDIENFKEFEDQFSEERAKAIINVIIESCYDEKTDYKKHGLDFLLKKVTDQEETNFENHINDSLSGEVIIDNRVIYFDINFDTSDCWNVSADFDTVTVEEFYLLEKETKEHLQKLKIAKTSNKLKNWK